MESILMGTFQIFYMYIMAAAILDRNKIKSVSELSAIMIFAVASGCALSYLGVFSMIVIIPGMMLIRYFFLRFWKNAIGMISYVVLINVLNDHIVSILGNQFNINVIEGILATFCLTSLTCFFIRAVIDHLSSKIQISNELVTFFVAIGVATLVIVYVCIFMEVYLGNSEPLIKLNLAFFLFYSLSMLIIVFFYGKTLRGRYVIKQKRAEDEAFQQYMGSIEQHYVELRKFRHDYKNLLLSLDEYFSEDDYAGLKKYYSSQLKPASETELNNDFYLDKLGYIKIKEVKSILAAKLILAQRAGFDAVIEIKEAIDNINMDSISLVRMLGIIMDNAIEELQSLKGGKLTLAIFKDEKSVHFIVQNDCRENILPVFQLKKIGYSTKGTNRGLGLSTLDEIKEKNENMMLETTIEKRSFTQHIIICEVK